jgi:hypothetical protein
MSRKRAKATAPKPPVEPTEPTAPEEPMTPVEPDEPATEAGRMIRKVVNDAIAAGVEVVAAVEAPTEPTWLDNVRRAKTGGKCPCGQPTTTLVVYGASLAEAWAANAMCDEHAAMPQVHAVAHTESLAVPA